MDIAVEQTVKRIPASSWEATSEKLIDIVLNSPTANKMPSGLAKTILYYWQRDQLATEVGMQRLLEASMIVDSERTANALRDLGFPELVTVLGSR